MQTPISVSVVEDKGAGLSAHLSAYNSLTANPATILLPRILSLPLSPSAFRRMAFLSGITETLGYETLPDKAGECSFYDLKADLPGKEKVYDFVGRPYRVCFILTIAGYVERQTCLDSQYGLKVVSQPQPPRLLS
jgi:hypothetical protein